jgi:GntR family transcriptional regulator, transcriptional repressor for pyruvate dehydrogenase complex
MQENIKIKVIEKSSLVDDVEQQLRDYIISNGFKPGDPMPKELELTIALGVSRSVVREALSRLRMLGLLRSVKRKGLIVTSPDIFNGLDRIIVPQLMDKKTMKDLFELRLILELGIAEILFARKTPEDISDLKKIISREKSGIDRAISIESEVEFHGKLYEIAGNQTLKRMQSLLWPVFEFLKQEETEQGETPHLSKVSHLDLANTLENGTHEEFREAMKRHIKIHLDRINNSSNIKVKN